ncbi:hypothetical protein [Amycolatopsis anabasis]|uniref:hypothetical protein n=1 Tax=Amycolatopsis anabasis TaxID=1840409 RepID=UPI00131A6B74|nr:hypothetical protein [Amycolatopsis anabasis]
MKIRQLSVVDAIVVGVTGDPEQPTEVVLARRDESGRLRQIGLSLPLAPGVRAHIGEHATVTGDPSVRVSTGVFGRGRTEFQPVLPELVVEAEASVESFTHRLRPRVHRVRLDLAADDLDP